MKDFKLALAPLTNLQSHSDGTLSDDEYNWLVSRAKSGFDITISCASHVSENGQGWPGELACFDDRFIPGLKKLADGIKACNSKPVLQIFHGGYFANPELVSERVAPSAVQITPDIPAANEMTEKQILSVIEDFKNAAVRAESAGWYGVEIHAANGYLLTQFLGKNSNQRTDDWGGSLENRSRVLFTIINEIKKSVTNEFKIGVRLSLENSVHRPTGINLGETITVINQLEEVEVDYIHLSAWDIFKTPDDQSFEPLPIPQIIKQNMNTDTPLMAAGQIWTKQDAMRAHDLGIDIIAIGTAAIVNPNWPEEVYKNGNEPVRTPVSLEYLKTCGLGPSFIDYLAKSKRVISQ